MLQLFLQSIINFASKILPAILNLKLKNVAINASLGAFSETGTFDQIYQRYALNS